MTGTILISVYVFVLAMFVGFEVITKVPPTLHTPLMSGSNAISGISIVGALVIAGMGQGLMSTSSGWSRSSLRLSTWWADSWLPTGCCRCSGGTPTRTSEHRGR